MKKTFCITVDLEPDYGRTSNFYCLNHFEELIELFNKYNIKSTFFLCTNIFKNKISFLKKIENFDIQVHSHSHNVDRNKLIEFRIGEIKKCKNEYMKIFNKKPLGYRSPQGLISLQEIKLLKEEGFLYDSSIFPTIRPGLYNNLKSSRMPFFYKNGILEIPFSTISIFPLSLSYIQLFGWSLYKSFNKKLPNNIVFSLHLHNLFHCQSFNELPTKYKLIYLRNKNKGEKLLKKFINLLYAKNYESITMKEYYKMITDKNS
jgi:peptidoglycan/xylan/chitin deacetylase (PgdA/CDA1 family)